MFSNAHSGFLIQMAGEVSPRIHWPQKNSKHTKGLSVHGPRSPVHTPSVPDHAWSRFTCIGG
jgi:hypothetical protein